GPWAWSEKRHCSTDPRSASSLRRHGLHLAQRRQAPEGLELDLPPRRRLRCRQRGVAGLARGSVRVMRSRIASLAAWKAAEGIPARSAAKAPLAMPTDRSRRLGPPPPPGQARTE